MKKENVLPANLGQMQNFMLHKDFLKSANQNRRVQEKIPAS